MTSELVTAALATAGGAELATAAGLTVAIVARATRNARVARWSPAPARSTNGPALAAPAVRRALAAPRDAA
jgi:hypothetical protein